MESQLSYKWTLWVDKQDKKVPLDDWDQFLIEIFTVQNVEYFWRLYNNIPFPSKLYSSISLYFFKDKIEPRWEDIHNLEGGRWIAIIPKQFDIDRMWEYVLVSLIGNEFEEKLNNFVNGIVLNVKEDFYKISIWIKHSENDIIKLNIGKCFHKLIKKKYNGQGLSIKYLSHANFFQRN